MHFLLDNKKKKLYNNGEKGEEMGKKTMNVVDE
jgi:hypothetical protein